MRAPKSSESADNPTGPPTLDDQCPTTAGFPPKSNPTYGIVNQDTAASDTWYFLVRGNSHKKGTKFAKDFL